MLAVEGVVRVDIPPPAVLSAGRHYPYYCDETEVEDVLTFIYLT
jgi:hypothetical protein